MNGRCISAVVLGISVGCGSGGPTENEARVGLESLLHIWRATGIIPSAGMAQPGVKLLWYKIDESAGEKVEPTIFRFRVDLTRQCSAEHKEDVVESFYVYRVGEKWVAESERVYRESKAAKQQVTVAKEAVAKPDGKAIADKQPGESKSPEPAPVATARIEVHVEGNLAQVTNPNPDLFRYWITGGPWLYVDEKLVGRTDRAGNPWHIAVTVKPGPHRVAVCFVYSHGQDQFPLHFHEYPVTVKSGETITVRSAFNENATRDTSHWLYAAIRKGERGEHLRRMEVQVQTRLDQIKLDLVARALDRALTEVKKKPPVRKVLWLELPEKYGGAREVDASQVYLLVDWLKFRYWDGLRHPQGPLGPHFLGGPLPPDELASLQRMQTVVEAGCSAFDQFRAIARALELAEKD